MDKGSANMQLLMMQQMMEDSAWLDDYQNKRLLRGKQQKQEWRGARIEVVDDEEECSRRDSNSTSASASTAEMPERAAPPSARNSAIASGASEGSGAAQQAGIQAKRMRWMMSDSFKRSFSDGDLEECAARADRDPCKAPPPKQRVFDISVRDIAAEEPAAALDFAGAFDQPEPKRVPSSGQQGSSSNPFDFSHWFSPGKDCKEAKEGKGASSNCKPAGTSAGCAKGKRFCSVEDDLSSPLCSSAVTKRSQSFDTVGLEPEELLDLPAPEFIDEGRSEVLRGTMALFSRAWSDPLRKGMALVGDLRAPKLQIEDLQGQESSKK
mmetsp:Transcript_8445/g.13323  ORF Transcript_8445/g.13323 Transcript_8445/m.13323 type:complete len:323 (+) Transcript_8445:45-1013(+)